MTGERVVLLERIAEATLATHTSAACSGWVHRWQHSVVVHDDPPYFLAEVHDEVVGVIAFLQGSCIDQIHGLLLVRCRLLEPIRPCRGGFTFLLHVLYEIRLPIFCGNVDLLSDRFQALILSTARIELAFLINRWMLLELSLLPFSFSFSSLLCYSLLFYSVLLYSILLYFIISYKEKEKEKATEAISPATDTHP